MDYGCYIVTLAEIEYNRRVVNREITTEMDDAIKEIKLTWDDKQRFHVSESLVKLQSAARSLVTIHGKGKKRVLKKRIKESSTEV